MKTIDITPLFTARALQEVFDGEMLWELGETMCFFCFEELIEDDFHLHDSCPHCGEELLAPEQLFGIECPFCGHGNPVPFPLDEDVDCENCGAAI